MSREPIEIVEIDVGICGNVYGGAPCTAVLSALAPRKCFNTLRTCQDVPNFAAATQTLRFAKATTGLPKGKTIFPAVQSISRQSAGVALSGRTQGPLGQRARVTVTLTDFTYHDRLTDPYVAERASGTASFTGETYDPARRGTFFGRLRARWPHYAGAALRLKSGYAGDDIAAMTTRHYVITDWAGPGADGRVTITAKDVLALVDNDKAVCPAPSEGQLTADISATATTFTITDATGYPASGRILIGSEILFFTRSGTTITVFARGQDGTTAASHSAGDTVQVCRRYDNQLPHEVLADLLTTFAGISAAFIPGAEWATEIERWMPFHLLSRTIAKPTGIQTLIGELLRVGIMLWWDDEAQLIRIRANRPPDLGEGVPEISDAVTVLADSAAVTDLADQRASAVIAYHGVIDASKSAADPENFARAEAPVSGAGFDQQQIFTLFLPWLPRDRGSNIARSVAMRHLHRFEYPPREVAFMADVKDKASLGIGGIFLATMGGLQDETGQSVPVQMQSVGLAEAQAGHRLKVTSQELRFSIKYGFITETGRPDYGASTAAEKAKGTYIIAAGSDIFADGGTAYRII